MALPSGYTRLEYIESTGTQYIDTGVIGSSNVRTVVDFKVDSLGSGTTFVFGSQGTDSVRYTLGMTSAGVFRSDYGTQLSSGPSVSLEARYLADKNGNVCAIGTDTIINTASTFTGTTNIYLFGRSYSSISYSKINLYSCQIYINDVLTRDFIPCKNADGVVGLWDDVNSLFYANAGTGTFTAGPVINLGGIFVKVNDVWKQIDNVTVNVR